MLRYSISKEIKTILSIGLALRLVVFVLLKPWSPSEYSAFSLQGDKDEQEYHQLALNILETGTFAGDGTGGIASYENLDARRPPGYPVYLASVYFIFGKQPIVAAFIQGLLSLLIPLLIYKITLRQFSKKTATYAGIIAAVEPNTLLYSFRLLPDMYFVICLLLGINYLLSSSNTKQLFTSGLIFGLACLFKPAVSFILIFFIPLLLWRFRKSKFALSAVPLISQFLLMSVWMIRNYMIYGYFAFTSIAGTNLYLYHGALTEARITGKTQHEIVDKWESEINAYSAEKNENPFFRSIEYRKRGIKYIVQHPIESIKTIMTGVFGLFSHMGSSDASQLLGFSPLKSTAHESIVLMGNEEIKEHAQKKNLPEIALMISFLLFSALIYIFSMRGILLHRLKYFSLNLLMLSALYFILITGVVGNARYRLPILPTIIILAAAGIPSNWIKSRNST